MGFARERDILIDNGLNCFARATPFRIGIDDDNAFPIGILCDYTFLTILVPVCLVKFTNGRLSFRVQPRIVFGVLKVRQSFCKKC
jgi:hypothetical protein